MKILLTGLLVLTLQLPPLNAYPQKQKRAARKSSPAKKKDPYNQLLDELEDKAERERLLKKSQDDYDLGWRTISRTKFSVMTYNVNRITRRPDSPLVQAWFMDILKHPLTVGRANVIAGRKKNRADATGYNRYSHALLLYEYNCDAKLSRLIEWLDYDIDGEVLDSERNISGAWERVIPFSVGEDMFKAICNQPTP